MRCVYLVKTCLAKPRTGAVNKIRTHKVRRGSPREAVSEPPACATTTSICTRDLHARQMPMPCSPCHGEELSPRDAVPTQNARHTGQGRAGQDEVSISLLLSSAMGGETSIRPAKLVPGVEALLSDAGCRARRRQTGDFGRGNGLSLACSVPRGSHEGSHSKRLGRERERGGCFGRVERIRYLSMSSETQRGEATLAHACLIH